MLTQAAQRLDRHPGPLGVFLRRLCRKKNRNVAVVATARKLVTVAFLLLKNNEPYRYAVPDLVKQKLGRVRFRATGIRQVPGKKEGKGHASNARGPSLAEVYQREGLPPAKTVEELPAGEQRMLRSRRMITFAREIQRGMLRKPSPTKSKQEAK